MKPIPALPPGIKYAIIWGSIFLTFAGGMYLGAKTSIVSSLENEVTVLVEDSEVANKIRAKEQAKIKKVQEHLNEINPTDCGKRPMRDILGLWVDEANPE